jgi:hypothetical protein
MLCSACRLPAFLLWHADAPYIRVAYWQGVTPERVHGWLQFELVLQHAVLLQCVRALAANLVGRQRLQSRYWIVVGYRCMLLCSISTLVQRKKHSLVGVSCRLLSLLCAY